MSGSLTKGTLTAVGLGLLGWWLRLLAHSKNAPPEGRWRELRLDDESA
ncbi:MAG TPA: hypothetical protein VJ927_06520 [Actinomycetota bacterium]|nr:hypothetical protein [Actinomycetota bacterium]